MHTFPSPIYIIQHLFFYLFHNKYVQRVYKYEYKEIM